mmetsp:Transcript_72763/g.173386  ORF Transcript_72763/g.173386 Transcript_72763/m.173386 type:complete len:229 (-) Transcript_72763:1665-2351(-)
MLLQALLCLRRSFNSHLQRYATQGEVDALRPCQTELQSLVQELLGDSRPPAVLLQFGPRHERVRSAPQAPRLPAVLQQRASTLQLACILPHRGVAQPELQVVVGHNETALEDAAEPRFIARLLALLCIKVLAPSLQLIVAERLAVEVVAAQAVLERLAPQDLVHRLAVAGLSVLEEPLLWGGQLPLLARQPQEAPWWRRHGHKRIHCTQSQGWLLRRKACDSWRTAHV